MQYNIILCNKIQFSSIDYMSMQQNKISNKNTKQNNIYLYNKMQHSIYKKYNTLQYITIQKMQCNIM